jgi:hypothetical protein
LRDLPVFSARIEAEVAEIEAQLDDQSYNRCGGTAGSQKSVMRVKNFVNIRRRPDFEADVVAEAPKYLMLTVVDDGGILVGTPEKRKRCKASCRQLKPYSRYEDKADYRNDRDAIKQCFMDNAIWYKVRLPDQREGYVSAKYLR